MILLIEPSKDLSQVICQALVGKDIDCRVAHSAEEAIVAAEDKNLELVVIELLMPRHNGLEFIYEFRSYADWVNIPIVVYSQLSAEELNLGDSLKRDMGIAQHLYKPTTTLEKLINEIEKTRLDV